MLDLFKLYRISEQKLADKTPEGEGEGGAEAVHDCRVRAWRVSDTLAE